MLGITDIAGSRTGRVTVACVPSAAIHFLPSVVSSFSERYPLIRVRVIDEAAGAVMVSVVSGESDFGITFMGNQVPGVDFEPIHTDPFVVAMPRRHALAGRKTLSWKSLETERLIAVARTSGNRQLLDDALAKAGVNPSYRLEVSHIATLLGMVERGSGLRPYRAWPCRNSIRRWSASAGRAGGVACTGPRYLAQHDIARAGEDVLRLSAYGAERASLRAGGKAWPLVQAKHQCRPLKKCVSIARTFAPADGECVEGASPGCLYRQSPFTRPGNSKRRNVDEARGFRYSAQVRPEGRPIAAVSAAHSAARRGRRRGFRARGRR